MLIVLREGHHQPQVGVDHLVLIRKQQPFQGRLFGAVRAGVPCLFQPGDLPPQFVYRRGGTPLLVRRKQGIAGNLFKIQG